MRKKILKIEKMILKSLLIQAKKKIKIKKLILKIQKVKKAKIYRN